MFSFLLQLLERFRSKPVLTITLAALALVIASVLLVTFVRWLRRRRQERPDNWVALLTGSLGNVLKVLVGLGVLAALCLHLHFQAAEFARLRGGTSERNYAAVKTIWGRPHVQRELRAYLVRYRKKYFDKDGLQLDPAKLKAATQPVAYREQTFEDTVQPDLTAAADHTIDLAMNYRHKGNASYPGFEVDCVFRYVLANRSGKDGTAKFWFPLPAGQGLVDKLAVTIDGQPVGGVRVEGETLYWELPMPAGRTSQLTVAYRSRGLDFIRIEPGSGRELRSYRIRMTCRGVRDDQVNYPIGCMTPTRKQARGDGMLLEWNLANAVTRLGMGVILPKEKQAGYYVARVLSASPWGLVLLLAMVLVTHLATARRVNTALLVVLGVAFYLYYLLMAHLGDYRPGLLGGMILSGVALMGLTALLQFAWGDRFAAAVTVALFAVFCWIYPLIVISEHEGLLRTALYVVLLAYVVGLLIRQRRRWMGQGVGEVNSPAGAGAAEVARTA